jgi:Tat protein translocase TatC
METAEQSGPDEPLKRMSFGDHLEELRKRVIRALAALVVCVFVVLPFKAQVGEVIIAPYRDLWGMCFVDWIQFLEDKETAGEFVNDPKGQGYLDFSRANRDQIMAGEYPWYQTLNVDSGFAMPYTLMAIGGLEDFWIFMMMSLVIALIIASPVVFYQGWSFIAAGLYKTERSVVYKYLPLSVGLMMGGVLFGYFVVVRYGLYFLVKLMVPDQVMTNFTVSLYFNLLFTLTAALGVVFQLPLVMLTLSKIGIVRHETFVKNWRYMILGVFVCGALFTPPDPFTQIMMAVPMMLLFLFGLFLTSSSERRAKKAREKAE